MSIYSDVRTRARLVALAALAPEFPTTPVIFSHVGGSEPATSYVIVNILNVEQQGHGGASTVVEPINEETATLNLFGAYEILVQYSFCGSQSGDLAQEFNHRISNDPLVRLEIQRNNLGLMRKSQVRRAPQKRDTQWVEYNNMDITFNYVINTSTVVDTVAAVVIETDFQDGTPTEIFSVPPGIIYP